mmetsp:Transcript_27157/g.90273  ORF Transcript_27157/g.90273 Transcript_27157/m.90273 type:complete len:250 (+) Transcript_27157:1029-1778(+)
MNGEMTSVYSIFSRMTQPLKPFCTIRPLLMVFRAYRSLVFECRCSSTGPRAPQPRRPIFFSAARFKEFSSFLGAFASGVPWQRSKLGNSKPSTSRPQTFVNSSRWSTKQVAESDVTLTVTSFSPARTTSSAPMKWASPLSGSAWKEPSSFPSRNLATEPLHKMYRAEQTSPCWESTVSFFSRMLSITDAILSLSSLENCCMMSNDSRYLTLPMNSSSTACVCTNWKLDLSMANSVTGSRAVTVAKRGAQ